MQLITTRNKEISFAELKKAISSGNGLELIRPRDKFAIELKNGPLRFCYWNRGLDTRCRSAVYRCGWILFSSGLQLGK